MEIVSHWSSWLWWAWKPIIIGGMSPLLNRLIINLRIYTYYFILLKYSIIINKLGMSISEEIKQSPGGTTTFESYNIQMFFSSILRNEHASMWNFLKFKVFQNFSCSISSVHGGIQWADGHADNLILRRDCTRHATKIKLKNCFKYLSIAVIGIFLKPSWIFQNESVIFKRKMKEGSFLEEMGCHSSKGGFGYEKWWCRRGLWAT